MDALGCFSWIYLAYQIRLLKLVKDFSLLSIILYALH